MTPPRNAGLHSWWRTCKKARSPIPGVSLSPLNNPLLSPPTTPTRWEGRGNLRRKQLRFYCRLGIDSLNAELHWRKKARYSSWGVWAAISGCFEDMGFLCYSQENGFLTAVGHHSPRRESTPANAVFAACPRSFSPPLPSHWQGEETMVIAAAL